MIRSLRDGSNELFVVAWPAGPGVAHHGLCMVVMLRQGGALLAVPAGLVSLEVLQGAEMLQDFTLGLHTHLTVPAVTMDGGGTAQLVGEDLDVLVLDVSDGALQLLTPFSSSTVQEDMILGFALDLAHLPDPEELLRVSAEWVEGVAANTDPNFYSAEEAVEAVTSPKAKAKPKAAEKAKRGAAAQVAEHIKSLSNIIPVMADQLSSLQEEQRKMQLFMEGQSMMPPMRPSQVPVSMPAQAFAQMMGSPPRTKTMGLVPPPPKVHAAPKIALPGGPGPCMEGSVLAQAMLQQSMALTSLVSHLQQGGDPLLDHQAMSSSTSSRGAAGRERLQKELSERSGNFFLQVLQNAFRRMKPASPLPSSTADIAATDFSMIQYLERCGGYGNAKELGLIMYGLAFVVDAAARSDMSGVQEHLAVLLVAIEQAAQDQNKWDLAFSLMLAEDPPRGIFTYGGGAAAQSTGRAKAFSPLCPQKWATVALAFAKEMDYIQTRRQDVAKKPSVTPQQGTPSPPNPKRRGKFPKAKSPAEKGEEDQA